MWEWGAFPQPSPAIERFPSTAMRGTGATGVGERAASAFPVVHEGEAGSEDAGGPPQASPSAIAFAQGATSSALVPSSNTVGQNTAPPASIGSPTISAAEPVADVTPLGFGAGGRLLPSPDDETHFWVDIEGKQFSFELSLCGPGALTEERDEIGDIIVFNDAKVSFESFVEDSDMLDSENLVIKWGET